MAKNNLASVEKSAHEPFLVFESETHIVLDNFLPKGSFDLLWNQFQIQTFQRVDQGGYEGHWLAEDGAALKGPTIGFKKKWHAQYPTETAYDFVADGIVDHAHFFSDLIGEFGSDWDDFTLFPALYPRDTGLHWHRDADVNAGSYTLYCHPTWNVEWGGALFVSSIQLNKIPEDWGVYMKKPARVQGAKHPITWSSHLDNSDSSHVLLEHGIGNYVLPKPNRLVILKGGAPHAVAKVNASAGNHLRGSISGFFKKTVR